MPFHTCSTPTTPPAASPEDKKACVLLEEGIKPETEEERAFKATGCIKIPVIYSIIPDDIGREEIRTLMDLCKNSKRHTPTTVDNEKYIQRLRTLIHDFSKALEE